MATDNSIADDITAANAFCLNNAAPHNQDEVTMALQDVEGVLLALGDHFREGNLMNNDTFDCLTYLIEQHVQQARDLINWQHTEILRLQENPLPSNDMGKH